MSTHVDIFIVLDTLVNQLDTTKRLIVSSWSASVSRTIKISTWCHLLATQDF